jgi:hypothetical protein
MLTFGKYFHQKKTEKLWLLAPQYSHLRKNDHNIGFQENRKLLLLIFGENREK